MKIDGEGGHSVRTVAVNEDRQTGRAREEKKNKNKNKNKKKVGVIGKRSSFVVLS